MVNDVKQCLRKSHHVIKTFIVSVFVFTFVSDMFVPVLVFVFLFGLDCDRVCV